MAGLVEVTAEVLAGRISDRLNEVQLARVSALFSARAVMPEGDAYDRIKMARFILTGNEDPEIPQLPLSMTPVNGMGERVGPDFIVPDPEDPGPEPPDDDDDDSAPSSGTHWVGRRG